MSTRTLCEAAAMDAAHFGCWDDACSPCDELAAVERHGYWLCRGCDGALQLLGSVGERERMRRRAIAEARRERLIVELVIAAPFALVLLAVAAGALAGWAGR